MNNPVASHGVSFTRRTVFKLKTIGFQTFRPENLRQAAGYVGIMICLEIETLILVAVWKKPFIFQGCFNITNKNDHSIRRVFFRCECFLENKIDISDAGYSQYDYTFTHIYGDKFYSLLDHANENHDQALYLLKYALNTTLNKMIINPKQYFTYIDEVAVENFSKQIKGYITPCGDKNINDDIGFAVSMDFTPTESIGESAALALLQLISAD